MLTKHHNINDIFNLAIHQLRINIFQLAYKLKMLFNCQIIEKNIELLAKTDTLSHTVNILLKIMSIYRSSAFGRLEYSSDQLDDSGLSCSIMSEQGEHLSLIDLQRKSIDCSESAKVF
jgi:hypothetical protein